MCFSAAVGLVNDCASDIIIFLQDPDLVVRFCKDVETRAQTVVRIYYVAFSFFSNSIKSWAVTYLHKVTSLTAPKCETI